MLSRDSLCVGLLLLLAGLVFMGSSCRRGGCWRPPPRINAVKAGRLALEMYDADKDGKLSGAELDKCPGLKAALARVNLGGGNYVDYEMIKARIQAWQASKLGRMWLRCMVRHNGQPLAGAEVKLVPEPFLKTGSEELETASGTTDAKGVAMLSIPLRAPEPPGVPPGFYRVEISKRGLKIPAKYNTETILGQEVAIDAEGIRNDPPTNLVFDLVF
jgi:hypothetical protein